MSVVARRALGGAVLLGAVLAVWLLWKRPDPFASRQTVAAYFTDADGLAPIGDDVRVAGVPVGKVTGVARAGSLARVTMTVSGVGTIRRDATAALRPRLMFEGTAYLALTLGSSAAPPLGDRVLPAAQTSTYVPFDDTLSVLDPRGRSDVRTLAATSAALSRGSAPQDIRDTLAAAPALTGDAALAARAALGTDGIELGQAVSSLARVSSAAAAQAPALGSLLASAQSTLGAAAQAGGGAALQRSVAELPTAVSSLRTGAGSARGLVDRAGTLVGQLQPATGPLKPTIDAVRPLLRSATPTLGALSPALAEADTILRGAMAGAAPAIGAINALEPTLDIYRDGLLSALQAPTDLGDPAYLAFLGLFAGGGGASRAFGVDGQGHFMRFGLRFLTGVGLPLPPCTLLTAVAPTLAGALESSGGCTP